MVEPKCKYFGECGGCRLQHIPYELQLENKKAFLSRAIGFEDVQVVSAEPYGYRNRMDFIFHPKGLGLRQKDKWYQIVDLQLCEIANLRIMELFNEVKAFFKDVDYFDMKKQSGTFRYCIIRAPNKSTSISFVLNEDSTRLMDAVDKIREFSSKTTAQNIVVTYIPSKTEASVSSEYFVIKGSENLTEDFLGKTFTFSVQGFFQNNSAMAEKMLKHSNDLLVKYDTKNAALLDLYGGVGTFGIINSSLFKQVFIVESFKGSIDSANNNILTNNMGNTKAICLDAEKLVKLDLPKPLYVITDPPRSGMAQKTIQRLNDLKPEVLIYISCNVEQLSKDLPKFKAYQIKSAALFDLFPQTPHSEAVVELVLRKE